MNALPATRPEMSVADIQVAAKTMAESGLFPQWNTPAKMMTLMLLCRAEGSDPVRAVNRYDNISGRVAKRPQAMLEDFIAAGGKVEWIESSDKRAEAVFLPPNNAPALKHSYTWEDVVRAGNHGKDNYKKYPKEMLRARLVGSAMRMVYPQATNMMYTPEELKDGGDIGREELNITPPAATAPATAMFAAPAATATAPATETVTVDVQATVSTEAPPADDVITRLKGLGEEKVVAYLRRIKWLRGEAGLDTLTAEKRKQIADKFDSFAKKVAEEGGAK